MAKRTIAERIIRKVQNCPRWDGDTKPCWVWTGTLDQKNNPVLIVDGKRKRVRRLVAELWLQPPLDATKAVKHAANPGDSPLSGRHCVNPAHLYVAPCRRLLRAQ